MSWEFEQGFTGQAPQLDTGYKYTNPSTGTVTSFAPAAYTNYLTVNVNGDVWVFAYNSRMVEAIVYNTWDYANVDYEKLSYHYYFSNAYDFNLEPIFLRPSNGLPEDELDVPYDFNGVKGPAILSSGTGGLSVTQWYNKLYMLGGNGIHKWDIETRAYEGLVTSIPPIQTGETIECTGIWPVMEDQVAGSNLCASNGKLFVTSVNLTNAEQQRVFMYDISTDTWIHNIIPGKHQLTNRFIMDGLDGYVWLTSKNNHSLVKISNSDGAITATVSIHRHPYCMMVNQSKEVYVAGDVNVKLVSILNQTSNASVSFCTGSTVTNQFYDAEGYLWFMQEDPPTPVPPPPDPTPVSRFARVRKSDLHTVLDSDGYKASDGTIVENPDGAKLLNNMGDIMSGVITKPLTYERYENGAFVTYNVKPYVFVISKTGAIKAFRCSALIRKNKYKVRGTAMIACGAQAYYGD